MIFQEVVMLRVIVGGWWGGSKTREETRLCVQADYRDICSRANLKANADADADAIR